MLFFCRNFSRLSVLQFPVISPPPPRLPYRIDLTTHLHDKNTFMHSIIYAALNFLKVIKRTFLAFVFCVSRSLKLFMISLLNLCKIKKYFSHFFVRAHHRYTSSCCWWGRRGGNCDNFNFFGRYVSDHPTIFNKILARITEKISHIKIVTGEMPSKLLKITF